MGDEPTAFPPEGRHIVAKRHRTECETSVTPLKCPKRHAEWGKMPLTPTAPEGRPKPHSGERNLAVCVASAFGAAKHTDIYAHVTHGKSDIDVGTAQRWQENNRR